MAGHFGLKECLHSVYSVKASHRSAPFGLIENNLIIDKDQCLLTFHQKNFFFIEKLWDVDVCRSPIHIKYGKRSVTIFEKRGESDDRFLHQANQLMDLIKRYGLIFAAGDREILTSDHGKVYCAYLLVKDYLIYDQILSRRDENLKKSDFVGLKRAIERELVGPHTSEVAERNNIPIKMKKEKIIEENNFSTIESF